MTRSSEPIGENSVRDSVTASVRTIRDAIEGDANARPDAPFLLAPEVEATVSYAALRDTAHGFAAVLAAHGVGSREAVSWMLPNGLPAAGVLLGPFHRGYAPSP